MQGALSANPRQAYYPRLSPSRAYPAVAVRTDAPINEMATQSSGSVNAVKLVEVGEYGRQLLLSTMLVEKSEDIVGPDSRSKVTERMAVLRSTPIGGINLQFVRFPRVLHRRG